MIMKRYRKNWMTMQKNNFKKSNIRQRKEWKKKKRIETIQNNKQQSGMRKKKD